MSKIKSQLSALRERWEERLQSKDPTAVKKIGQILRQILHRRRDAVEDAVEALWDSQSSVWLGMYTQHYHRSHSRLRRRGVAIEHANRQAHAAAVQRVRRMFFLALRKQWVDQEDERLRWMWAGGFAELLEEIDGKGLTLLLEGVLAVVNIVSSRVPLLTTARDVVEDLADSRIEALLDAAMDEAAAEAPEPAAPTRREAVKAEPIRERTPNALLSQDGETLADLDEAPEPETDDDDEEEDETVVAADPTAAPARAPLDMERLSPVAQRVAAGGRRHQQAEEQRASEARAQASLKARAARALSVDLSELSLEGT